MRNWAPESAGSEDLTTVSGEIDARYSEALTRQALRKGTVPTEERRWRFRHGWLTADALEALGQTDAAQATLQNLLAEFPDSIRVRRRLEQMGSNAK